MRLSDRGHARSGTISSVFPSRRLENEPIPSPQAGSGTRLYSDRTDTFPAIFECSPMQSPFRERDSASDTFYGQLTDTEIEGGTGPGGRVAEADWGCLVNMSWKTVAEGVTRPSEVRALMALLYWPS